MLYKNAWQELKMWAKEKETLKVYNTSDVKVAEITGDLENTVVFRRKMNELEKRWKIIPKGKGKK